MGFISAFSYIPYISRVIYSIGVYRKLRDVPILAQEIGQVIVEVTEPHHKGRADVQRINAAVVEIIKAL